MHFTRKAEKKIKEKKQMYTNIHTHKKNMGEKSGTHAYPWAQSPFQQLRGVYNSQQVTTTACSSLRSVKNHLRALLFLLDPGNCPQPEVGELAIHGRPSIKGCSSSNTVEGPWGPRLSGPEGGAHRLPAYGAPEPAGCAVWLWARGWN